MTQSLLLRGRNTWLPIALGGPLQPVAPVRSNNFCFITKPRMTRLEARETYFEIRGPEIGSDQSIGCSRRMGRDM